MDKVEDKTGNSRSREIVNVIISGIKKNTFKPGERLPSQLDMAELFGVSRTVVREAVKILEGQGIVYSRRGSGIYVSSLLNLSSADSVAEAGTNEVTTREILQVGRELWYLSFALIMQKSEVKDIDTLDELVNSFYRRYSPQISLKERYIHETTFGLTITKLSNNRLLHLIMCELFEATSDIDYEVVTDYKKYREILEIDLKIVEALREKNPDRVELFAKERDHVTDQILADHEELLDTPRQIHIRIS